MTCQPFFVQSSFKPFSTSLRIHVHMSLKRISAYGAQLVGREETEERGELAIITDVEKLSKILSKKICLLLQNVLDESRKSARAFYVSWSDT